MGTFSMRIVNFAYFITHWQILSKVV